MVPCALAIMAKRRDHQAGRSRAGGESWRWLAGWLVAARSKVIGACFIVTVVAAFGASKVRVDSNLIGLLPEDAASVQALREFLAESGGTGDLMVMFESTEAEATLAAARNLLPQVRALPWVEDARFGLDESFFETNKLLYVDLDDLREVAEGVDEYEVYAGEDALALFRAIEH